MSSYAHRKSRPFGLAVAVNSLGTGVYYPFAFLFLSAQLSGSLLGAGVALVVANYASLLALPLTGSLIDSWGPKRAIILANAGRGAAMLGYLALDSTPAIMALTAVLALGNRVEQTSVPVLVMDVPDSADTQRLLALSRALFNAGFGAGSVVTGVMLAGASTDYAAFALINGISFFVAAVLYLAVPHHDSGPAEPTLRRGGAWRDRRFVGAAAVSGAVFFVAMVAETLLPVYVVRSLGYPGWVVSALLIVNTVMLAACQLPTSSRVVARSSPHMIILGLALHLPVAVVLQAGPASLSVALPLLGVGIVVYSVGEIVVSTAVMRMITGLCPPGMKGRYMTTHQVMVGSFGAAAPLAVGVSLSFLGTWAWTAFGVVVVLVIGWVVLMADQLRDDDSSPEATEPGRETPQPTTPD